MQRLSSVSTVLHSSSSLSTSHDTNGKLGFSPMPLRHWNALKPLSSVKRATLASFNTKSLSSAPDLSLGSAVTVKFHSPPAWTSVGLPPSAWVKISTRST